MTVPPRDVQIAATAPRSACSWTGDSGWVQVFANYPLRAITAAQIDALVLDLRAAGCGDRVLLSCLSERGKRAWDSFVARQAVAGFRITCSAEGPFDLTSSLEADCAALVAGPRDLERRIRERRLRHVLRILRDLHATPKVCSQI